MNPNNEFLKNFYGLIGNRDNLILPENLDDSIKGCEITYEIEDEEFS